MSAILNDTNSITEKKINTKKPPLGLMPKDIWEYASKKDRFENVRDAIYRYLNDYRSLNSDWINEYNELLNYLNAEYKDED